MRSLQISKYMNKELPEGYSWLMMEEKLQEGDEYYSGNGDKKLTELIGNYANRNFTYMRKVSTQPADK